MNIAALATLQRQTEELRSQLEARDQTIAELGSSIERLQSTHFVAPSTERSRQPGPTVNSEVELARRLVELTVVQSNTLALVERLMERVTNPQPVESPQQKQAGLAALELSVKEHQQKLDAAKQRAEELLLSLGIPADISTMDGTKALATASLKPYWPFFEALRERDHMMFLMEKLQARLLQEQLDARAAAEKSKAQ